MTKEQAYAQKIANEYKPKQHDKLDELKKKNEKVKRPAQAFAYTFGIVGTLVLGVGMCLALKVFADLMPLGIVVGIVGIAMICANYFIYKSILKRRKAKYGEEIVNLSNEILNEN